MTIQIHLFPETAVVHFPTSYFSDPHVKTPDMASLYGVQHRNLTRLIDKVIKDIPKEEQLLNFEQLFDVYINHNGAKNKRGIYLLSEAAFAYIAAKPHCPDANRHTWQMVKEFKDMRRQLAALKERESAALYALRPRWQPIAAHPGMKRAALIALTGHRSPASITACRRRMRQVGLLARRAA
jgi:Rha family phage regulatory protein